MGAPMGPTNKENMPLELGIVPLELEKTSIQKVVAQVNQFHTTSMKGKWTNEALEEAMETIELEGIFPLWGTSLLVEIPPPLLQHSF